MTMLINHVVVWVGGCMYLIYQRKCLVAKAATVTIELETPLVLVLVVRGSLQSDIECSFHGDNCQPPTIPPTII